jgi:cysteinyl-tRNA synthetase
MYFCGPTVYARAHVGNARPFVVGMWLRSWLRSQGYDVTLVHNITDVNDKIYDAAPGASAELAEQATAWYLEDVGDLGLGLPDHLPKVTEHIPQIVAFIELADRSGHAYPVDGDVYFRVASFPEYGRLSGNGLIRWRISSRTAEGRPRDFALWKANKPGEDTALGRAVGTRPSRLAHRVLGDGRAAARPERSRSTAAGSISCSPPRERACPVARTRPSVRADLGAQRLLQFTGEKMSKSVGNIATLRDVLDEWGRERCCCSSSAGTGASRSTFRRRRWLRQRRNADIVPERALPPALTDAVRAGTSSPQRSTTTSTPRRALAVLHEWRRPRASLQISRSRCRSSSCRSPQRGQAPRT